MTLFTIPFFRKKVKRELPLLLVHTFKSGEKLYTYRPMDYGKISSRYYRNLQEATNYIHIFGLVEKEWKHAVVQVKQNCLKALDGKFDKTEALTDVVATMDYFTAKITGVRNADHVFYDMIFCMFYVLEEEKEMGYNAANNQKKLDLLDQEPEMRDFFLTKLKQDMKSYMPTFQNATAKVLARLEKMQQEWMRTLTQGTTTLVK